MAGSSTQIPQAVTDGIRTLIADAGIETNQDLIARILATGIGLGLDDTDRLDLKIASAALTEMRAAFSLFAPFRGIPKVTIFGSARTRDGHALSVTLLSSDMGKLYVALAQAIERLRK